MTARISTRTLIPRQALAVTAVCLAGGTGCYHYAPLPITELEPAMTVRMELSGVAVDRLRRGPDSVARLVNGFNVSGTVARLNADSVVVSVPTSYMEANVRLKTQLHDLPLFRSDVQRVQWRRLDRARTTWVGVGVGVVGATAIALVLNRGGRSSGGIPKPVDPVDARMLPALSGFAR
jgi:hypothetical protein